MPISFKLNGFIWRKRRQKFVEQKKKMRDKLAGLCYDEYTGAEVV
jgi:hypothetical protein